MATLRFWDSQSRPESQTKLFSIRIRLSLSLLLQLLAVLLLALAFAQPTVTRVGEGWPRTIVIVDNSASMSAVDATGQRLAAAQFQAAKLLGGLGKNQEAMIIVAASSPAVAVPFTSDNRRLKGALNSIGVTAEVGDIDAALRLAVEAARNGPPAKIHVFSDGAYAPPSSLRSIRLPLEWHSVGRETDNVGITAFAARRSAENSEEYQAFVTLANVGSASKRLSIRMMVDHNSLYEEQVELGPRVKRSYVVPFQYAGAGVLRAQVDPLDGFAPDNAAFAVLPEARKVKVSLVSPGNPFLESALRSDPRIDLKLIGEEQLTAASADVVILDRISPDTVPPGNYLLIHSLPSNVPISNTGSAELASIAHWDAEHPVLRHLDLTNVGIARAMTVRSAGNCTQLIESERTPVVLACDSKDVRVVFVGFDVLQSELPFRAAFPMFLRNAVDWLARTTSTDLSQQVRSGDPITAEVDQANSVAHIARPDGRIDTSPITNSRLSYYDTELTGIYSIDLGTNKQAAAVNLLDAGESDLTPGRGIPSGDVRADQPPEYNYQSQLWPFLAIFAFAVLSIEIAYYLYLHHGPVSVSSLLLRALALLLLATALFNPTERLPSRSVSVVALMDVSDSVPPLRWRKAFEELKAAVSKKDPEDNIEIIAFAGDARRVGLLEEGAEVGELLTERKATDIAAAIRLALGSLPPEGARRILLVSDGNENRHSALAAAWAVQKQGVQILPLAIGGPQPSEVFVDELNLPNEVKLGEPFDVRAQIWSAGSSRGKVSLYRDDRPIASADVTLRPGRNVFSYQDVSQQKGIIAYSAEIRASGDIISENNRVMSALTVQGEPRVLYVDTEFNTSRGFLEALRKQHFFVDVITPEAFSKATDQINGYDSLILGNIPASDLSEAAIAAIATYVAEHGGGLIMLGGENSFGVGGYGGTAIEDLLPVQMEPRARVDVPSQAIVLVIDRSGSMSTEQGELSRIDMAKLGAQLAVNALSGNSEVGVLAFDTEADWVVPLQAATDKQAITGEIGGIETGGGGTELLSAIKEAYRALKNRDAMLRHIIVLSDGEAPLKDFKQLLEEIAGQKITVSSIAISSQSGQDLLERISIWGGGRYYYTSDLHEIPRIFTTETNLASNKGIIEESFYPSPIRESHELLKGVDWGEAPQLHGYVSTTPKPTATILLTSPQQDPVLAVWRHGLGRTIAFTSDVKGRWARDWLAWGQFNKFFGQLVRWTLRQQANEIAPKLSFGSNHGNLIVEVSNNRGQLINFLDGEAGIVYPQNARLVVPITQSAPGTYFANFPAGERGLYLAGVSLHGNDKEMIESTLGIGVVPYPPEYKVTSVNSELLTRLAEITKGEMIVRAESAFRKRRTNLREIAIWHWLLLAALLGMIGDLGLRWINDRRRI